jgi:hypothetical protein
MKLARDLFKEELAKAKTAEEKRALAKKLLQRAKTAKVADADTFVLLRLAHDISVRSSDCTSAFEAIAAMSDRYQIDAIGMKADVLSALSKRFHTPPQHLSVAEQAAKLMAEAEAVENYDQAVNLAKLTISEGGLGHDKEIVTYAKSRLQ